MKKSILKKMIALTLLVVASISMSGCRTRSNTIIRTITRYIIYPAGTASETTTIPPLSDQAEIASSTAEDSLASETVIPTAPADTSTIIIGNPTLPPGFSSVPNSVFGNPPPDSLLTCQSPYANQAYGDMFRRTPRNPRVMAAELFAAVQKYNRIYAGKITRINSENVTRLEQAGCLRHPGVEYRGFSGLVTPNSYSIDPPLSPKGIAITQDINQAYLQYDRAHRHNLPRSVSSPEKYLERLHLLKKLGYLRGNPTTYYKARFGSLPNFAH